MSADPMLDRADSPLPVRECDCGATTTGKWANIHSSHCAVGNLTTDLEARIHAVAVKHRIALPEPVVREMVAYLLKGIRP